MEYVRVAEEKELPSHARLSKQARASLAAAVESFLQTILSQTPDGEEVPRVLRHMGMHHVAVVISNEEEEDDDL